VSSAVSITAFYKFLPLAEAKLRELSTELKSFGESRGMRGLVLLAPEGINGTVSATAEVIEEWKEMISGLVGEITFKDSAAAKSVFKRWSIKIKPEIVGLHQYDVQPKGKHKHVSPAEWQEMLEKEDVVLIDARNAYEVAIGKFRGAVDPNIIQFNQFAEFAKTAPIPKDKKVLMYCTGGIRCEKAILEMEKHGYEDVYQLDGGILAYLKQFPHKDFEGECFVFDKRVAVDQNLEPSQIYGTCPHCGDPGDIRAVCRLCSTPHIVCERCTKDEWKNTCSKACANIVKKRMISVVA
jgi:UPF0176 protein